MKIDTEGTYTLTYTATDSCGNSTSEERTVVVASPRTVLYTDGTFIINEQPEDRAANVAAHGEATNVYEPYDESVTGTNNTYNFSRDANRPWDSVKDQVLAVEIGSPLSPIYMPLWFSGFANCTSFDFANLNTENTIRMYGLFYLCSSMNNINLSNFDTTNVLEMNSMFDSCTALTNLDISSFTKNDNGIYQSMFARCTSLTTIYASTNFDLSGLQSYQTHGIFEDMSQNYSGVLVGGAGTQWTRNAKGGAYARLDNPPDAPGYFTAKE